LAAFMNWKDEQYIKNYKQFQKFKKRFIPKSESPEENYIYFDLSLKKSKKKEKKIETTNAPNQIPIKQEPLKPKNTKKTRAKGLFSLL